jgi:outer membrane protein insertion porin family/translocation and assembly module TamA
VYGGGVAHVPPQASAIPKPKTAAGRNGTIRTRVERAGRVPALARVVVRLAAAAPGLVLRLLPRASDGLRMTRLLLQRFGFVLGAAAALFLALGCTTVPPGRSAVDAVDIRGADKVDDDDVEDKIATTASPKLLGLFRGVVYEYELFDRNVLQRDLARVEAFYRAKGYYEAHARAGRVFRVSGNHVRVEIVVEEGPAVHVRNVTVEGIDDVPKKIADLARSEATGTLKKGAVFEEEAFDKAMTAVRRALTDNGYAYAKVTNDAAVDIVEHRVDIIFTVTPGEPQVFGDIKIEGLGKLPDAPVRRAIDIKPGTPYSEEKLKEAEQAVLDLGVFASVDSVPDLPDPPRSDHVVPVTFKCEVARLRTVRLGGGLEFDSLRTDVHGVAGWEDRNLFGGMRSFSVTVRPGIVLYPIRVNNIVAPTNYLPEASVRSEFRQPGFPEARTNLFFRPEASIQALLFNPNPPPDQRVVGYLESRNALGLDRRYGRLFAAVSFNLQYAYPFEYVGTRDPTLEPFKIIYPELLTQLDFRNDRIHPRRGIWLGNTFQAAGGPFGGDAADVKVQPDVRGYVPISQRLIWASRVSVGFLFPRNYGAVVRSPSSIFVNTADRTRDYQLTFFRGFFSGGSTSNRGYPTAGVGPQAIVPFISPEAEVARVECTGNNDCRVPTGGFTLWEASVELRYKITGPFNSATFCDASDVSPQVTDIRLNHPHLSCGVGARYDTPVGPVRFDVGYRIPGLQVIGGLTPDEKEPKTFVFGIPIAVSLGIGEAY